MKDWLLSYLTFSKKERLGIAVLLGLILIIWLLPGYYQKNQAVDESILQRADSLAAAEKQEVKHIQQTIKHQLFYFDPNTITSEQWEELGLPNRTILTISNYLSKGGRFREPSDLGKIYGIRKEDANRLMPFVKIKQRTPMAYRTFPSRSNPVRPNDHSFTRRTHERKVIVVDVNSADSAAFESLPAIGSKLATRIIRFREALGGFHNVEQLREVYGINDTVFNLIAPSLTLHTSAIRKVRINEWDVDSLDRHPYIQKHEARAIVKFRQQHGPFAHPNDLAAIGLLSSEWINKMLPYLQWE